MEASGIYKVLKGRGGNSLVLSSGKQSILLVGRFDCLKSSSPRNLKSVLSETFTAWTWFCLWKSPKWASSARSAGMCMSRVSVCTCFIYPSYMYFLCACMHAKLLQSCLTLCNFMDCSPPDSSVHGILQPRILEGVAILFSRGSSWPRDQTCISCLLATWEAHLFLIHIFNCTPMFSVLLEETFPFLSLPRFRYEGTAGKETWDYNKRYLKNAETWRCLCFQNSPTSSDWNRSINGLSLLGTSYLWLRSVVSQTGCSSFWLLYNWNPTKSHWKKIMTLYFLESWWFVRATQ